MDSVQTGSGTPQPPIQCVRGFFFRELEPEGEAGYSRPSSAEIKNLWSSTSVYPNVIEPYITSPSAALPCVLTYGLIRNTSRSGEICLMALAMS
jgi:hypothetical protein